MKPIRLKVAKFIEGKLATAGEYTPGTTSFDNIMGYVNDVKQAIFDGKVRGDVYSTENLVATTEVNGSVDWLFVEVYAG